MMAVETVETHFEETGGLPYSSDTTSVADNTRERERERDNNNNNYNNLKTTSQTQADELDSVSG